MEDAIAFLKAAGITGAARAAVATLLGSVREAHKTPPALEFRSEAVISKVSDAWGMLVVQPPGAPAACASVPRRAGALRLVPGTTHAFPRIRSVGQATGERAVGWACGRVTADR